MRLPHVLLHCIPQQSAGTRLHAGTHRCAHALRYVHATHNQMDDQVGLGWDAGDHYFWAGL